MKARQVRVLLPALFAGDASTFRIAKRRQCAREEEPGFDAPGPNGDHIAQRLRGTSKVSLVESHAPELEIDICGTEAELRLASDRESSLRLVVVAGSREYLPPQERGVDIVVTRLDVRAKDIKRLSRSALLQQDLRELEPRMPVMRVVRQDSP